MALWDGGILAVSHSGEHRGVSRARETSGPREPESQPDRASIGEPSIPPTWRLPDGVNAALWEYVHNPRLAEEEDDYFAGHPLFRADAGALDARFVEPGPLVDLGCGTGRHALRFARRGFPVVAVDLSRP